MSTEPSLDEQIEWFTQMLNAFGETEETAPINSAILASLKSLRDQPDAGMREALEQLLAATFDTSKMSAARAKARAALSQQPVEGPKVLVIDDHPFNVGPVPVAQAAGEHISPALATKLLRMRDEFYANDHAEAFHILYGIADPTYTKHIDDVWADLEATSAAQSDKPM